MRLWQLQFTVRIYIGDETYMYSPVLMNVDPGRVYMKHEEPHAVDFCAMVTSACDEVKQELAETQSATRNT